MEKKLKRFVLYYSYIYKTGLKKGKTRVKESHDVIAVV